MLLQRFFILCNLNCNRIAELTCCGDRINRTTTVIRPSHIFVFRLFFFFYIRNSKPAELNIGLFQKSCAPHIEELWIPDYFSNFYIWNSRFFFHLSSYSSYFHIFLWISDKFEERCSSMPYFSILLGNPVNLFWNAVPFPSNFSP